MPRAEAGRGRRPGRGARLRRAAVMALASLHLRCRLDFFQPATHPSCCRCNYTLLQDARDYRYAHPPIRVRPASSQEGAAYLAQPVFSSCTVPIVWCGPGAAALVWASCCMGAPHALEPATGRPHPFACRYPMWAANLAHFFRGEAGRAAKPQALACWLAPPGGVSHTLPLPTAHPSIIVKLCPCTCRQCGQAVWCAAGHALGAPRQACAGAACPASWLACLMQPLMKFMQCPAAGWCSRRLAPPAAAHVHRPAALARFPWRQVTAEGHAAPGMNYDILQPLTRQRVETWADFSARLPSQQVRSVAAGWAWCMHAGKHRVDKRWPGAASPVIVSRCTQPPCLRRPAAAATSQQPGQRRLAMRHPARPLATRAARSAASARCLCATMASTSRAMAGRCTPWACAWCSTTAASQQRQERTVH